MAEHRIECGANELLDARIRDDDWTGKTDPVERRRRQNRLHQRAWRRRKAQQDPPAAKPPLDPTIKPEALQLIPFSPTKGPIDIEKLMRDHITGRNRIPISLTNPRDRDALWALLELLDNPYSYFALAAEIKAQRKREINPSLLSLLSEARLPVDQQLFSLIQHNAMRGVMTNMAIVLGLKGRNFEGWDDFYVQDLEMPHSAPASLTATELQKNVKHEAWIDVLPYARFRDNIIRNQDNVDADTLCEDFLGGWSEGVSEVESRGMILWGEPWSAEGWEVSEGFVRKWGFLMEGCGDLIRSTNRWREARGERRLFVEV